MTLALADRVKETTTTTGVGTYDLGGAVSGFRTFVAGAGNGAEVEYAIASGSDFEVGVGTVTDAATDTLSRDTILASSNGGSAVSWGAGSKDIWLNASARLFLNSLLRPIAKSAAYTAVAGDLVIVTSSGSNFSITLPASPLAGDRVAVKYFSQTVGDTVTVARNGKLIDGNASDFLLYVAGDYVELEYDGTRWVIGPATIVPHRANLRQTTAQTNLTQNSFTQVTFQASDYDNAGIASTTNNDITPRRAGEYYLEVNAAVTGSAAANRLVSKIAKNNGVTDLVFDDQGIGPSGGLRYHLGGTRTLSASDTVEFWINPVEDAVTDTDVGDAARAPQLAICERLDQAA